MTKAIALVMHESQLIGRQAFFLEDTPHLPGADRNIDMAYANMSQRVDNGIGNRLRRTNGGRFANTLGSDGVMRRRCNRLIRLPVWCLHRGGDQVVLEVAAVNVAILVERYLFVHCRGQPLRQATMYLPFNDHRVDDCATVIHGHEAANVYFASATVDIHDTNVAAERIRQVGRIVVVHCLQPRLQVWRAVCISGQKQLPDWLYLSWWTPYR